MRTKLNLNPGRINNVISKEHEGRKKRERLSIGLGYDPDKK